MFTCIICRYINVMYGLYIRVLTIISYNVLYTSTKPFDALFNCTLVLINSNLITVSTIGCSYHMYKLYMYLLFSSLYYIYPYCVYTQNLTTKRYFTTLSVLMKPLSSYKFKNYYHVVMGGITDGFMNINCGYFL